MRVFSFAVAVAAVTIVLFAVFSDFNPVTAQAYGTVLSVTGNPEGITGQLVIANVSPKEKIFNSSCKISSYSNTSAPLSSGGIYNYIPLKSPANGAYPFSCTFDEPSVGGAYYAEIKVSVYPEVAEYVEIRTGVVSAGGGIGVASTQTATTQSASTSTSSVIQTLTPYAPQEISAQPSVNSTITQETPVTPRQNPTSPSPSSDLLYLALALALITLVAVVNTILLLSYRKRSNQITNGAETAKVIAGQLFCANCERGITADSKFCNHCGERQS